MGEIAEQINVGNAGRRHAQRSSIRYAFLTPIRMVNVSGKRIWASHPTSATAAVG